MKLLISLMLSVFFSASLCYPAVAQVACNTPPATNTFGQRSTSADCSDNSFLSFDGNLGCSAYGWKLKSIVSSSWDSASGLCTIIAACMCPSTGGGTGNCTSLKGAYTLEQSRATAADSKAKSLQATANKLAIVAANLAKHTKTKAQKAAAAAAQKKANTATTNAQKALTDATAADNAATTALNAYNAAGCAGATPGGR